MEISYWEVIGGITLSISTLVFCVWFMGFTILPREGNNPMQAGADFF